MIVNTEPRNALTVTLPSDLEIVMTRMFNAPRRLVFDACTKPEHLKRWWGGCGEGSSMPVCEVDLRPGGAWRFVSRAPDGAEHPFKGVFREVSPPGRLVFTQIYDVEPFSSVEVLVTVALEEHEGRTKMTETLLHRSKEERDGHLQSGLTDGAGASYDRLDELTMELYAREQRGH